LSQTIVVLPVRPSLAETSLFLNLMSHFGAQTGYPALQVKVEDQYAVIDKAHDYLILGTIANQPAISSMDASLPVTFDLSGVHVKDTGRSLHSLSSFDPASSRWWSALMRKPFKDSLPSNTADPIDALVEEIESPVAANRSIVLIALKDAGSSDVFTSVLFDRSHSGDLTGSVSLLRNAKFESYVVGDDFYHVGDVSSYSRMRIWLSQNFVLLLIAVMSLSFVIARWTRNWLQTQAHERLKLAECDDRSA
jgi:cellulose synthase (UDP-forming)